MATNGTPPKITLYTNHGCPFAHRAHITLKELGLAYDEVIIDLTKPREPWYLEVNPRGLVPSIKFSNDVLKDEILTESAIVVQFLTDSYPSHLSPQLDLDPKAALKRARAVFFADTWATKVQSIQISFFTSTSEDDVARSAAKYVETVEKEIEPLLQDAAPFFGGSKHLTLAEVLVLPFVLRAEAISRRGMIPSSIYEKLNTLPNFSKWMAAGLAEESVSYIWNEDKFIEGAKIKAASLRKQK